jgi:hypothetical protein
MAQFGEHSSDGSQQWHRTVIVLDLAVWTRTASNEPSVSVTTWRLRPFTFLATSNPRGPPLSVVFTLWLSMMPADGVGLRPTA